MFDHIGLKGPNGNNVEAVCLSGEQ